MSDDGKATSPGLFMAMLIIGIVGCIFFAGAVRFFIWTINDNILYIIPTLILAIIGAVIIYLAIAVFRKSKFFGIQV